MNVKLDTYAVYIREVKAWIQKNFALASPEEQLIILEKTLLPIEAWEHRTSASVQEQTKEFRNERPSSFIERYGDVLEPGKDGRSMHVKYMEDKVRWNQFRRDAENEGWDYDIDNKMLVRSGK